MDSEIPRRSWYAHIAVLLERWLSWSSIWGFRGMLVSTGFLLGYLILGWILTLLDSPMAPSDYFSLTGDPGFVLFGTLVSFFVVQVTGSLILYHFLTGIKDERSQFVVLMSYIGLGSGAAALRVLLPHTLALISDFL